MTDPQARITDAITGDVVTAERHNHWVIVGYNGRNEMWLTPTAARDLAAQVIVAAVAAVAVVEADEVDQ